MFVTCWGHIRSRDDHGTTYYKRDPPPRDMMPDMMSVMRQLMERFGRYISFSTLPVKVE